MYGDPTATIEPRRGIRPEPRRGEPLLARLTHPALGRATLAEDAPAWSGAFWPIDAAVKSARQALEAEDRRDPIEHQSLDNWREVVRRYAVGYPGTERWLPPSDMSMAYAGAQLEQLDQDIAAADAETPAIVRALPAPILPAPAPAVVATVMPAGDDTAPPEPVVAVLQTSAADVPVPMPVPAAQGLHGVLSRFSTWAELHRGAVTVGGLVLLAVLAKSRRRGR